MDKHESVGIKKELPRLFDWKQYVKHPEKIEPDLIERLNALTELINENSEETIEFRSNVALGAYRKPLLSLIQFFRDIVGEDRARLFNAIEAANKEN